MCTHAHSGCSDMAPVTQSAWHRGVALGGTPHRRPHRSGGSGVATSLLSSLQAVKIVDVKIVDDEEQSMVDSSCRPQVTDARRKHPQMCVSL